MNNYHMKKVDPSSIYNLFIQACSEGMVKKVQNFVCNPSYRTPKGQPWLNIHAENSRGFRLACERGYIDIVKFLTTSPELKEAGHTFVDIQTVDENQSENGFLTACWWGQIEVVKFLTTNPALQEAGQQWTNIHAHDEWGFRVACLNGHLEIVQYLTTSTELKAAGHTFVDIHAKNDKGFLLACEERHEEILRWWIIELSEHPEWKEKKACHAVINDQVRGIAADYPRVMDMLRAQEEKEHLKHSLKNIVEPIGLNQPFNTLRL